MLDSILLRWVARSSDSIVSFFVRLDARLDVFIAKHDDEVAAFEDRISGIKDDAITQVQRIEREAAEAVGDVEAKIAEKRDAAAILLGLKSALPTAKVAG